MVKVTVVRRDKMLLLNNAKKIDIIKECNSWIEFRWLNSEINRGQFSFRQFD